MNKPEAAPHRIALTSGEPAGIGPDLIIQLAQQAQSTERVILADPDMMKDRANQLGLPLTIRTFDPDKPPMGTAAQEICLLPIPLKEPCIAGQLNPHNAKHVLSLLDTAIEGCVDKTFDAMVTAPVNKAVINDAGITFSGHTEFLAEKTHTEQVVMMLATEGLRVALLTTHLPLKDVPEQITGRHLEKVLTILQSSLQQQFGLSNPRITVLGLNPHAGESGHMGREEIDEIIPCMTRLNKQKFNLTGPLPADTAFTPHHLSQCDAVLAMYHDQGLPVLKYKGFGNAVNITLGLPIIRTSVDHGTALDLAGKGTADCGSLVTAIRYAEEMASHQINLNGNHQPGVSSLEFI